MTSLYKIYAPLNKIQTLSLSTRDTQTWQTSYLSCISSVICLMLMLKAHHMLCDDPHTNIHTSQMDFLAASTLTPSMKVWPSLALFQEMSGSGSPSATQEIMAALPSTAVTFFSWVMWGWTGGPPKTMRK